MILVLSSQDDMSTNDVLDWLFYYQVDFLRISNQDTIRYQNLIINANGFDVALSINDKEYLLSDFTAFWYRRSHYKIFFDKIEGVSELTNQINAHCANETNEIHKIVTKYIEDRSLNKYGDIYLNKLEVLNVATRMGLKIPDTLITTKKSDLEKFYKKHKSVVTKNFSPGVFIFNQNEVFSSFTKVVTKDILNEIPSEFMLSLFQENIDKIFEIRLFFIEDKFYSSAIFSQNDDKTKVDFRDYNFEKPNRTPPFYLDEKVKKKLIKTMNHLGLNSGSIDMLVTNNNEYIFLEVNPIGQFSQVSIPCNYYIEDIIAKYLIKHKNAERRI